MATVMDVPPAAPAPVPPASEAGGGDTATKEKNDSWRFLEPQPVREDQVENAVKFLSHPKVKGSPVVYRRSFLEKKGLSREEIDEAFRRVPDPPSDSSTSVPAAAAGAQTGALVSRPLQVGQVAAPVGQPMTVPAKSTSWTQMFLALGVLTVAGAGAGVLTKRYFIPKFKEWILDIVSGKSTNVEPVKTPKSSTPSPVEEATKAAAAAAAAAASAATQVAGAMQEIAKSRSEDRQHLDSIIRAVETQTQELKETLAGMKDVVQIAEVTKHQRSVANNLQSNGFGADYTKTTLDYTQADLSGAGPTPASESRAVTTKPSHYGTTSGPSTALDTNGEVHLSSAPTNGAIHAPHSQSYLDVMAMLERGEKPPGIKEVNDKPPNPNQPPSNPRLQPRPKPWEKPTVDAQPVSSVVNTESVQPGRYSETWNVGSSPSVRTDSRFGGSTAGSSSEPWWRKKVDTDYAFNSSSVKITEVDPVTEADIGTVGQKGQSTSPAPWQSGGRPGWVPPAIPQPIYPGAEEAIRRPKPAAGGTSAQTVPLLTEDRPAGGTSAQTVPLLTEDGPVDGSSSSSQQDPQLSVEPLDNPNLSNGVQPEVPGEQEPDYPETSLVDSTPLKDVEQEGEEQ